MAKISNTGAYPNITDLDGKDYIIITDKENYLMTKTCTIAALQTFFGTGGITLTVDGTSGPSTLTGTVLNIPNYATGGSGTVTSLTTTGTSGLATLTSGVLNVPNYTPYERVFMELNIHDNTLNPEIQVHYNTTGATFTVATNAAGLYVITASSGIFNASTKTHFSVMNPNILPPLSGTGELPMQTIARVKTTTEFGVDCYRANSGTDSGVATNLPTTGFSVTIEFRIYNISI